MSITSCVFVIVFVFVSLFLSLFTFLFVSLSQDAKFHCIVDARSARFMPTQYSGLTAFRCRS